MTPVNGKHVEATVIRLAAERGGVAPESVNRPTHFRDDLQFDSLDIVELTMALEEEFEMSIPDADVETLATVGDVIDYVVRRTSDAPVAT